MAEQHMKKMRFGAKMNYPGIKKFKAQQDIPSVIAVLSLDDIFQVSTHYEDGVGTFFCFEGECCDVDGFPKPRVIVPIISYQVLDHTTYAHGAPVSLQYLALTDEQYKDFQKMQSIHCPHGSSISDFDILVTCADSQFQRNSFDLLTNQPCVWRSDEILRSQVWSDYQQKYFRLIEPSIGRSLTRAEYLKLKSGAGTAPSSNQPSYPAQPPNPQVAVASQPQSALPPAAPPGQNVPSSSGDINVGAMRPEDLMEEIQVPKNIPTPQPPPAPVTASTPPPPPPVPQTTPPPPPAPPQQAFAPEQEFQTEQNKLDS